MIGNSLKTMLSNAKKVDSGNRQRTKLKLVLVDTRISLRRSEESLKKNRKSPTKSELLYTEDSPSFCQGDDTLGTPGVSGRICSKNSSDINSCRLLCCGRGYHQFFERETTNCQCKFKYCCFVQCKKCTRQKLVAKCR